MAGAPSLRDDISDVIVSEQQLDEALNRLAASITADLGECRPLLVGVLTGAFMFMADLVRRLDFPLQIEFICARSYGEDTQAGELTMVMDLSCEVAGRHVLIVDDILDSGHTLALLVRILQQRGAASVRTCCLLDKPARRAVEFEADYVGVRIPDRFVVGYGLDYAHHHRNLPFVGVLRPELYRDQHQEPSPRHEVRSSDA